MLVRSGTFLYGTPEEIRENVLTYHEAGVDEVVLNTVGVGLTEGLPAAVADVQAMLKAVWLGTQRLGMVTHC